MSIIIFLVILSALVIVHELGHFLVAKKFGIRVDEFGLGYPPRAKKLFSWRKTDFTLNWLPFGGFVKIFGENPSEEAVASSDTQSSESFQNKNRSIQALVLVAGVVCNFLFAWLLIFVGFMGGLPAPASLSLPIENPRTVITIILPGTPASDAGLRSGDAIISLSRGEAKLVSEEGGMFLLPEEISNFIAESPEPITFRLERGGEVSQKVVTPSENIIADRLAIGISMEVMGTIKLPIHKALWEGLKTTVELTFATGKAIGSFFLKALGGRADLASVTGPVGLVGMVGDIRELGFSYLLTFTALISLNLSLINLLPFPALDGGRLLFVGIEAVTRRPIPVRIFNAINAAGFALLIFLMILITIRDVRNIF